MKNPSHFPVYFTLLTLWFSAIPSIGLTSDRVSRAVTEPLQLAQQPGNSFEGEGRPSRRVSGGSRNPCLGALIALVPGTDTLVNLEECQQQNSYAHDRAFTTAENPVFWVYLPEQFRSVRTAELTLMDRKDRAVWQQPVSLTGSAGVLAIPSQEPVPSDQSYRWVLEVQQDPQSPSRNPTVEGWIYRQPLGTSLANQLQQTPSPQQKASLYQEYGFWYDALTLQALHQCASSGDERVRTGWRDLLNSQGLGVIAAVPIVNCDALSSRTNL